VVGLVVGLYFAMKPKNVKPEKLAETITAKSGEMALVPAGPFKYREKKEDATLPAYYIDKTEVTNQAYAAFLKATGHTAPPDFPSDKPAYPVVNVTIDDAKAFAKWAGERLPTPREWEKAARGTDGRMFPWGNEADPSHANMGQKFDKDGKTLCCKGELRPAADFAEFAGPYKTVQMMGNVWELVDERTNPGPATLAHFEHLMKPAPTVNDAWYPIRGGSFSYPLDTIAIWDSGSVPGNWKDTNIGFRCVKDAQSVAP
jgi:formylglycine-generating enzyme required for sulfatase activity